MTPTDLQLIIARMEAHERADDTRFNLMNITLAGIGGEGTPLSTRLARLEDNQRDRSKLNWAILTVALALLGERMVAHMQPNDPPAPAAKGGP